MTEQKITFSIHLYSSKMSCFCNTSICRKYIFYNNLEFLYKFIKGVQYMSEAIKTAFRACYFAIIMLFLKFLVSSDVWISNIIHYLFENDLSEEICTWKKQTTSYDSETGKQINWLRKLNGSGWTTLHTNFTLYNFSLEFSSVYYRPFSMLFPFT